MFVQLKPLIDVRALTVIVAALPEGRLRVCVVPQLLEKDKGANGKIGYAHKSEVAELPESAMKALITPLSLTGSPEELDRDLPKLLANYVEKHLELQQTFDQACKEISQAVDAIKERDKNKPKGKRAVASKTAETDDDAGEESSGVEEKAGDKKTEAEELPLFMCKPEGDTASKPAGQASLLEEVKH